MDTSSRRALLEGLAFGEDVSGHERLGNGLGRARLEV
jgi:hypothetical protein